MENKVERQVFAPDPQFKAPAECMWQDTCQFFQRCQVAFLLEQEMRYQEAGQPDQVVELISQSTCPHPQAVCKRAEAGQMLASPTL